MNIHSPWVFYTPSVAAAAAAAHHPLGGVKHPGGHAPTAPTGASLIPINCPPGAAVTAHSLLSAAAAAAAAGSPAQGAAGAGSPFGVTAATFSPGPATAVTAHPRHHHHHPSAHHHHHPAHHHHTHTAAHPHHPAQILLAAAAAAYGQQCAAASHLLHHHQHHHPHPATALTNGTFRIQVDDTPTIVVGPPSKRKSVAVPDEPDSAISREIKKAKLETKALKAKRPGFTDERYNETSYYTENGLRKVYPYYFTFTTFTKGRWVGEKILDVFAKEFRAHPVEEYERCIKSGTLTVNYTKVETDYRLKHNDLLANIVHRHEVPVTSDPIEVVHMDEDLVVVNKPASIPVHPCGRYRHNTVVFILAKEHQLKNLRTIHRLDRLTSGLLLFGRSPKKAREMEQQIRNRLVAKEYVCRVEGTFPDEEIECSEPIEVVSYKIGVCKVSKDGKECRTVFKKLSSNGKTSVVLARPRTGRMHQIRVHLQYLGYPIVNDPLYNHPVFGPEKGKGGLIGKTDDQLIQELISIHNAENWLGIEGEEGGGGGADIFGSSGTVTVVNDPCHLNTASGPSSCTSVQSDNGSSVGSTTGEVSEVAKIDSSSNNATTLDAVPEMKSEGTQVASPVVESKEEKVDVVVNGGKVTVGTQTNEDESSSVGATDAAAQGGTVGPDCVSSGSQTTPSVKSGEGVSKDMLNAQISSNASSDNNNTSVSITKTDGPPGFRNELMTYDPHCYECKVRYRDPKPKDLVMYLHALTYRGPEWSFETKMPAWASHDWLEPDES